MTKSEAKADAEKTWRTPNTYIQPLPPITQAEDLPAPAPAEEAVNHPNHYGGDTTYEAIKVIEAWELDFCLGNTVKYISRAGKKDGNSEAQDLRKALWYLQRRIAQIEGQA